MSVFPGLGVDLSHWRSGARPRLRQSAVPSTKILVADAIEHPDQWALVLDYDGTTAPFVRQPSKASPGIQMRGLLKQVARQFAMVAYVSGRPARFLRDKVGNDEVTYVGLYGAQLKLPGNPEVLTGKEFLPYIAPLHAFAERAWESSLKSVGVLLEDKEIMMTYHWRGAADPVIAERAARLVAAEAEAAGFSTAWGEMNVEIRPPIPLTKEDATKRLLSSQHWRGVIIVGDESSDMASWTAAKKLQDEGGIDQVIRVGVRGEHTPPAMPQMADKMVAGVRGVERVLRRLAGARPEQPPGMEQQVVV